MDIEIDFPKKITRKTHKEWTQHCEVEFILFDLPVECMMKNKSLSSVSYTHLRAHET